jgi:hypothetical protein
MALRLVSHIWMPTTAMSPSKEGVLTSPTQTSSLVVPSNRAKREISRGAVGSVTSTTRTPCTGQWSAVLPHPPT